MTYVTNPTHYTRDEFRVLVDGMSFNQGWTPLFPTLHNTGVPSLKTWQGYGATPQERWGASLNSYYKGLGWHSGVHLVCCPDYIWNLCDLRFDGVSVSCWNRITIGIECVGNYEVGSDDWSTGDGAKVRDNAAWVLAVLCHKFGWKPEAYVDGRSGLHFHRECTRDHHACPGSKVAKPDMIDRVNAQIAIIAGLPAPPHVAPAAPSTDPAPLNVPAPATLLSVDDIQAAVNKLVYPSPNIDVDGDYGPATKAAVAEFQAENHLDVDGWVGPQTTAALLSALATAT